MFILTAWLPNIDTLLYVFDMLPSEEEMAPSTSPSVTGELNHCVLKAIGLYLQ